MRPPGPRGGGKLIPLAEQAGVYLTIENIFANGYLLSPQEMVEFVDSFQHDRVRILFDTGNIMQYQFPEHWIPILGRRIQNVHFKEYNKRIETNSIWNRSARCSTARPTGRR